MQVQSGVVAALIGGLVMLAGHAQGQPGTKTSDGSAEGSVQPASNRAPDLSPLVHEGVINAPVGEVWKVFSTPEGYKRWGVAQCEMDFRVGGVIRTHYSAKGVIGDEGTIVNRILAFEPERMTAFRIEKPPKGFPFMEAYKTTWSVATLTDLGDGRTHLRLTGLGYTADKESQEMREFFKNGNAWSMKKLQAAFDAGVKVESGARAHEASPLAPVEHERIVAAPAMAVYERLTTGAGWKHFLGAEARIEAEPGGTFEIEFDQAAPAGQRGSEGCKVLSVDPGRMISFSWNAPPKFEFARAHPNWVVITLEPVGGAGAAQTRVRLRHLGFADLAKKHAEHASEFEETRAYFERAWGTVLERLAASWEKR